MAIPYVHSSDNSCQQPEILTSSNPSIQGSAIKVEGAQTKIKQLLNKPTLSVGMLKKNISHLSLKHHINSITNSGDGHFQQKSSNCLPLDFAKEVPKLKLNQAFNEKNLDTILSGRRHIEKAYNKKNQVIVTHDNRSAQMIQDFSNMNLEQKSSRRDTPDDQNHSLDNHFKRSRASSQQSKSTFTCKKSSRREYSNKKHFANTILGVFQKQNEVQSYKKDGATLLCNRIQKKLREYYHIILEFALFQEEIQAMKKFDSQFDIQKAFESFKKKQEQKGCRASQLKFSRTQVFSQAKGKPMSKLQMKENKENIFLSQDKINSKQGGKGIKDSTPLNIFQTYLQGQSTVSPIDLDYNCQRNEDFEAVKAVDDEFDFNDLKSSKLNAQDLKTSFKDKIKGFKNDFTQLLSHRNETKPLSDAFQRVNNLLNTQRFNDDEKENIEENLQIKSVDQRGKQSKLSILREKQIAHHFESFSEQLKPVKKLSPQNKEKLLEIFQIKELKLKFFAMYNFKSLIRKRDHVVLDTLSEFSQVNPQQLQTRMLTKDSVLFSTQMFDEGKCDKRTQSFKTVFKLLEYRAQKEKVKAFHQWSLKSKNAGNEFKTEILKQIIEQKFMGQQRKALGNWRFQVQNFQENKNFSQKQSLDKIQFILRVNQFKQQHSTVTHWKRSIQK